MKRILNDKLRLLSSLNKITSEYSLGWGSLLGLARNGRIIPWDDDIDVLMTWSTYKRLSAAYPNRFFWYRGTLRYTDENTKIEVSKEDRWVPNYIDVFILMQPVTPDIKTLMQRWINCDWNNFKRSTWQFRFKNLKYYLLHFMGDRKYLELVEKYATMPKQDKRLPLSTCFIYGKDFILNCPFETEKVIFNGVQTRAICKRYLHSLMELNYNQWKKPVLKPLHNCTYRLDGQILDIKHEVGDTKGIERDLMIVHALSEKHVTSFIQFSDKVLFFAPRGRKLDIEHKLSVYGAQNVVPVYYRHRTSF